MNNLSPSELKRYNRHIILPEIGMEGQLKLKAAKVLVIGAGGLGCPILQYLTAAGVGTLGIVDFDIVDESNLQRQILYSVDDIGKFKSEVSAYKLKLLNPFCYFQVFNTKLNSKNVLSIFKDFDLIIDGSDNFPTRYLINDACVILNKPLVFGSIFKFEGQLSVLNYNNGPTYRCIFPEPPNNDETPNCSTIGVIGVLPGIIGCLQANEAIKIITGMGEVLTGKLYILNALTMSSSIIKLSRVEANANIKELIDYESFCETKSNKMTINEISVEELKDKLDNNEDILLIDVRENFEREICHIGGLHIPLKLIPDNIDKIPTDKPVVIYCHHGNRSAVVINTLLEQHKYENLYNLVGGVQAWATFIDDSMEQY